MLYNKHNLEVIKIAAKTDIRPELASVFFTNENTVATDGFRLIEMSTPVGHDDSKFPAIEGYGPKTIDEPFMVSAKELKYIKVPSSKMLPVLEHFAIKNIGEKDVDFYTTTLESVNSKKIRKIEGQYPAYKDIKPKGNPQFEFNINGNYLAELLEISAGLNKMTSEVTIKFYGDNKPVVIESENKNQKCYALCMPMYVYKG